MIWCSFDSLGIICMKESGLYWWNPRIDLRKSLFHRNHRKIISQSIELLAKTKLCRCKLEGEAFLRRKFIYNWLKKKHLKKNGTSETRSSHNFPTYLALPNDKSSINQRRMQCPCSTITSIKKWSFMK